MQCENYTENKATCNCTYEPCERKGYCCQCLRYHLKRNELPACFFPPEVEKTYDRSRARYLKLFQA